MCLGLIVGVYLVGVGNFGKFFWSNGIMVLVDGNCVLIFQYIVQFGGYQFMGVGNNCFSMLFGIFMGGVFIVVLFMGGNSLVYMFGVLVDSWLFE